MERTARRRASTSQKGPVAPPYPIAAESPLLAVLFLAPLTAGKLGFTTSFLTTGPLDPVPSPFMPLLLGCLAWTALLLRLALPDAPPLRGVARHHTARWLVWAFPLVGLASLPFSATPGATILQTLQWASAAIVLLLVSDIAARGGVGRLLLVILAGALVSAGLGVREYAEHAKAGDPSWRAFAEFTNPNFLAGYLVPVILLTLGLAAWRPEAFKPAMWTLVLALLGAVCTAALMVTGSRGGVLSLLAGLVVLAALGRLRGDLRGPESLTRLAVLGVLVVVIGFGLTATLRARQITRAAGGLPPELCPASETRTETGESNRFRFLTWQGALKMAQARPVLGWGAGTFETASAPFTIATFSRHAHNSYLQLFAEEGAIGLLTWLALLLTALLAVWKLPRGPEWAWGSGVGAAIVAGVAHGVFDSLLYVPAVLLLTCALIGMAFAGLSPEEAPSGQGTRLRQFAIGGAVAGVLVTGLHLIGRGLLAAAKSQVSVTTAQDALDTLGAAQALLPWDHQVADTQREAYQYLGLAHLDEAAAAAGRALRLCPERPFSYLALGHIREAQQRPDIALFQYDKGLQHFRNDTRLWYDRAKAADQIGEHGEALKGYRELLRIESTPAGQVSPLGNYRDFRFAVAHQVLAADAQAHGDAQRAFGERKRAACLLAVRRNLYDVNSMVYHGSGEVNPQDEADLRSRERQLWRGLAEEYRKRHDGKLAALSEEQAQAVDKSWERLQTEPAPDLSGG